MVDIAALGRCARTSEHHFRRTFSSLAGIPIGEYVRRRRMTLAAADVLAGELTLLDVAVKHGYGSTEAFSRAFRAVHGMGAGEARRNRPPAGLEPAGTWLVLISSHSPYPEGLQQMWLDAYGEWFPANPWRTRPGPDLLRAEWHDDDTADAELWLPIEPDPT